MKNSNTTESIAEQLAAAVAALREPPREVRETAEKLVIDIAGLCVAARATDYAKSALAASKPACRSALCATTEAVTHTGSDAEEHELRAERGYEP